MKHALRERVTLVTAVLSVVSLVLVFAAAGRRIPEPLLPPLSAGVLELIPHVNAVISAVAIVTILYGVRAIRNGDVARHRAAMLSTFGLFVAFLVLYLSKVAIAGTTDFGGPATIETFVYYPTLAVHILLAIVTIPLVYYVLLLAATHEVRELPQTRHAQVGKAAAGMWLVSFAMGLVVYLLLYVVY